MKKKLKKRYKFKLSNLKTVLIVLLIILLIYIISNIKIFSNNSFIKLILKDINSYISYEDDDNILDTIFYAEEAFNYNKLSNLNINYYEKEEPIIYIYNTHDHEGYLSDYKEGYNLKPTIVDAARLLQDELNNKGLLSIVEDRSVNKEVNKRGYDFTQSYTVSREYILDTIKKYPNLKLIIDLHRDAVDREYSYITYNDKNYAKVLFVMGKRYDNYKENLSLAKKIDDKIKNQISSISRGIMINDVEGHNGVYNQDINTKMILLELGSNNNTVDEIYNTIIILANAIEEVINEDKT